MLVGTGYGYRSDYLAFGRNEFNYPALTGMTSLESETINLLKVIPA
jgi:hypothetical protein